MYSTIQALNYQVFTAVLASMDSQIAEAGGETVGYDTPDPVSGDWSQPPEDNGKSKVMSAAKAACDGDQISKSFSLHVAINVTSVTGTRDGSESGFVSLGEALAFLADAQGRSL